MGSPYNGKRLTEASISFGGVKNRKQMEADPPQTRSLGVFRSGHDANEHRSSGGTLRTNPSQQVLALEV